MDVSKILLAVSGFTLAVCLVLSVTALASLRNTVAENEAIRADAQELVERMNSCIEELEEYDRLESIPTGGEAEPTDSLNAPFTIRAINGCVAVLCNEGQLITRREYALDTLPVGDRERLERGITVNTWKEVEAVLKDYFS